MWLNRFPLGMADSGKNGNLIQAHVVALEYVLALPLQ